MDVPNRFDPASVGVFRVVGRSFDRATGTVALRYALDDRWDFVETITFESPFDRSRLDDGVSDGAGLDAALGHLHVAAGTSYYKTAAPRVVDVETHGLRNEEAEFHRRLYDDGLREFAVANGLPVPRSVDIRHRGSSLALALPSAASARPVASGATAGARPSERERPRRLVVPIGGGKDSLVLAEAVRALRPRLLAVNPHPLVHELAHRSGLELLVVRRRLDPRLVELNAAGALNGHVPVTAIVSLIAVVGSFLYGYDSIAMAVERSADEETVVVGGAPVNHQYSKSSAFEQLLSRLVVTSIDPDLAYGSALRPYSELAIARAFARLRRYHGTFCSCNAAFRRAAGPADRWCGHCPKCRFVALMLAPFMDRIDLESIIGADLFDDSGQIEGFAALMSAEDKPFECVGERREAAAAFRLLTKRPQWQHTAVVEALADRACRMVGEDGVRALLAAGEDVDADRLGPEVAASVRRFMADGR